MNHAMTRRVLVFSVMAALCAALSGCSSSSPSKGEDVGSLQITDKVAGAGADAINGRLVTVHYTGWLYSSTAADHHGSQFDSSRGAIPYTFVLGSGTVIRGWDLGVLGMKAGGQRTLTIPSSLGYGPPGYSNIPGGSALVFDIELLEIR